MSKSLHIVTQVCLHNNNKNTSSLVLICEHFSTFSLGWDWRWCYIIWADSGWGLVQNFWRGYLLSQNWNESFHMNVNSLMKTHFSHPAYLFLSPGFIVSCPKLFPCCSNPCTLGLQGRYPSQEKAAWNTEKYSTAHLSVQSFSEVFYLGKI